MLWKSGRKAEVQGGGWCAPSSSLSLHKTPPPRVAHSISGAPSIPPSHLLLFTSSAALSSSALPLAHLLTRDPGKELQRSLESLVTATPGRPRQAHNAFMDWRREGTAHSLERRNDLSQAPSA